MTEDPVGRIRVTGPGPLVIIGLVGVVLGWVGTRKSIGSDWSAPTVGWSFIAAVWFVALITVAIAYLTRRSVRVARADLPARQGLNRLVLGKTVARVAAWILGVCLGVAISRLGVASNDAGHDIVRALVGALGAAAALASGLLLEHACRVPPDDGFDLP